MSDPVDIPEKVTPLGPGDPVEVHPAMGSTFAERKAAREGKTDAKQVENAENKAVTRKRTSRK